MLKLNLSRETTYGITPQARAVQAKDVLTSEDASTPSAHLRTVLTSGYRNLTHAEFKTTIATLESDQKVNLVALSWLRRGNFDISERNSLVKLARSCILKRTLKPRSYN